MPKCKVCREPATKRFGLVYACGIDHAVEYAQSKRDRLQAKESARLHQIRKEAVRPLKWYADKAQQSCNQYVRARDKDLPCISCGCHESAQWDAGHFRPAGINSALKYDESNLAKQCCVCNRHKSGNLIHYRAALIERIGEPAVLALEQNNEVRRYSKEELIEIRQHYQQKLKALSAP